MAAMNFSFCKGAVPSLSGVGKQVEYLKRELPQIQAVLEDADSRPVRDERQRNRVKEVRDVYHSMEAAIDRAAMLKDYIELENPQREMISLSSCYPCKKMFRKVKKIPALYKLRVEIYQILTRINEVTREKNDIEEGRRGPELRLPNALSDTDDSDVIGFKQHTDNIVQLLLDERKLRRSVVSIVGVGGIGKTTLAQKVYNRIDIKKHFDLRIWLCVSQGFKLIDLLKKMVIEISTIDPSEFKEDEEYFLTKVHECCMGKKYLIVLDDVWTSDLWTQVKIALPDENNGSRVLITSRIWNVAVEADPQNVPYQLNSLTDESSLELLLKKALPNRYPKKDYPDDLVHLAKQFVKRSHGLPLALVALGGLLSQRPATYYAWSAAINGINGTADLMDILTSSFANLSLSLKNCFMYLAIFPEDFCIDAKTLVRMWVAEGFIPELENETLEDTGESFLEELVQRGMIQVRARLPNGSIEDCRVHDSLRDLAIEIAKYNNFLMVSSTVDDLSNCRDAHRLAVYHHNCDELTKYASKNLRSLVCFGPVSDCSKQSLLRVLRTKETELKWLEGLARLKYFELKTWKKEPRGDEYFKRFLCRMKFLETLDLRETTRHPDLPDCIWQLKTLRHVMLSQWRTSELPSWTNLENLQTLTGVKNSKSWKTDDIPKLPNLRKLDIEIVEGLHWEVVASFLSTLKHLSELCLSVCDVSFKVPDMSGFPFYRKLLFLHLRGFNDDKNLSSLNTNMFPIHLTSLNLSHSELNNDPMPILEELQNLKTLTLIFLSYRKKEMKFSIQGFAQLELLELQYIHNLEKIEIKEGAMSMLKQLSIRACPRLCVPQSLKHLTSLKMLQWSMGGEKLASTKANEIRSLRKHLPSLKVSVIF